MSYPHHFYFLILLIPFFSVFLSCSGSLERSFSVEGRFVFEYKDENSMPHERMSIFLNTVEDFPVIQIRISAATSSYEWIADCIYKRGSLFWCQNLCVPDKSHIPMGKYEVTAVFMDGSKQSASFVLSYPEYCTSGASQVRNLMEKDFKSVSTVINTNNIKNFDSAIERTCFVSNDKQVLCILPEHKGF